LLFRVVIAVVAFLMVARSKNILFYICSPVAAFKRALQSPGLFTSINISDGDEELLAAATKRLSALNAPVRPVPGPASEALPKIIQSLNRSGLHLAFLDA
jgi:hypothetical protein